MHLLDQNSAGSSDPASIAAAVAVATVTVMDPSECQVVLAYISASLRLLIHTCHSRSRLVLVPSRQRLASTI
jgi:hypothetical protein